jgi:hypothetical protein
MVGRLGESLRYAALLRRFGILERDAAEGRVLENRVKREGTSRANVQEGDRVTT